MKLKHINYLSYLLRDKNSLSKNKEIFNINNKEENEILNNEKRRKNKNYLILTSKTNNISLLFFNYFILLNLIIIINSKKNLYKNRKLDSTEVIVIKIKGSGTQSILNSDFLPQPNEVYVNDNFINIDNENKINNLLDEENNITMKWNDKLESFASMFNGLSNIIEIDFLNFDTSRVTAMNNMFCDCTNLISVKINNLDTSLVTSMGSMFKGCHIITSLNLSSFNTSIVGVMSYMFEDCFSLISLDLSNFKTPLLFNMLAMFDNCYSLVSLNISNLITSKVSIMVSIFNNCFSLKSLDLSNFDTSSVYIMGSMFANCTSLTSLDLSNFNTSSLVSAPNMFYHCDNLILLNISNFNLTKCFSSTNMFYNCSNLKYIDLNNVIEGNNLNSDSMFDGVPENVIYCSNNEETIANISQKLKAKICSINDCSNNWISKQKIIINEKNICVNNCSEDNTYFYEFKRHCYDKCPEGTRLSSNNDNICLINCPEYLPFKMNEQCIEKCNIKDFYNNICIINNQTTKVKEFIINETINEIINGEIYSLLLNTLNNEQKDLIVKDIDAFYQITTIYNQNNINYNDNEIVIIIGECEDILKNIYKINSNETLIMFKIDFFIEEFYIPITEYEIFHPDTKEKLNLTYCNDIPIYILIPVTINEEDIDKHNPYSEYYSEENFLNTSESLLNDRINEFNNNNLSLCEKNCVFMDYYNITKKVLCKCKIKNQFMQASEIYNKKNELLYHIQKYSKDSISLENNESELYEELNKHLNTVEKIKLLMNNENSINEIFDLYIEGLKNESINKTKDEIIIGENSIFQVTTPELQKYYIENNLYNNISSLDLKECEHLLKLKYGISDLDSLIILKMDISRNDTISTQIEYEVYNPYNYEKLNLSICENIQIDIYPPINLNQSLYDLAKHLKEQGYDLFNSYDDFYTDICSPYNSVNNTDVTIKDRKYYFYASNITLCEETCEYKEFYVKPMKAKCRCNTKTEVKEDNEVKFSPNKIIENFYKVEKYTNIKIIICYKSVFSLKGQKNNIGSYIVLIIFVIFIIIMIINFKTFNSKIMSIIKIISIRKKSMIKELDGQKNFKYNKKINNKNNKKLNLNKKINTNINNPIKKGIFIQNNKLKKNLKKKNYNGYNNNKNHSNSVKIININNKTNIRNNIIKNISINQYYNSSNKLQKLKTNNKMNKNAKNDENIIINKIITIIPKGKRYIFFCDNELNNLKYEYALFIDFRSFSQTYLSLLKQTHLFIFTFIVRNDYNIFLLKLSIFLLTFSLSYTINAFFFNDKNIHRIYEDKGKYNFLYQIPKIIYSTIITQIISFCLENLSLYQDDFLKIKEKADIQHIKNEIQKIKKHLKIKCFLFFIIGIFLLFGFWYYLSAFNAVYYNTKVPLIKDTVISFFTSMLYPFILILLPVISRITSLRYKIKCLYIFSKFITIIIGLL